MRLACCQSRCDITAAMAGDRSSHTLRGDPEDFPTSITAAIVQRVPLPVDVERRPITLDVVPNRTRLQGQLQAIFTHRDTSLGPEAFGSQRKNRQPAFDRDFDYELALALS